MSRLTRTAQPLPLQAVLFDLDGTLVDTAPDLIAALHATLAAHGRSSEAAEPTLRRAVSHGSGAMLAAAVPSLAEAERVALRLELIQRYQADIARQSRPFPGMQALLGHLEAERMPWGVVTNKPEHLAAQLLAALGLRPAVLIGGDTLAKAKPHPEPLWAAAETLNSPAAATLYLGDAPNDMEAARRAGMPALLAGFGYLPDPVDPAHWGALGRIEEPLALLEWWARS